MVHGTFITWYMVHATGYDQLEGEDEKEVEGQLDEDGWMPPYPIFVYFRRTAAVLALTEAMYCRTNTRDTRV